MVIMRLPKAMQHYTYYLQLFLQLLRNTSERKACALSFVNYLIILFHKLMKTVDNGDYYAIWIRQEGSHDILIQMEQ